MDHLARLLHDAAELAAPECDPVPALRRRRARHRCRRRLQVTAGALLAFAVVGQALLPPPASGAERPPAVALATAVLATVDVAAP